MGRNWRGLFGALQRGLRYAAPVVVLAILAGALWLLYARVKTFDYQEFLRALEAIPPGHVAAAIGLTVLNYLVLISYDLLNIRYMGHRFSFGKIALGSLTSYMVSNTFGMWLGGSAVRYRLYSAWGLTAGQVAELIALLGLTFWLGVLALAGCLFVAAPLPIPDVIRPYVPMATSQPAGVALLVFVALYLLACAVWRRPWRIGRWRSQLPPLRISLYQIAISSADIAIAGAVMYVLLPADSGIGFLWFLGVYLLGVVFSVLTHVPGQLGVLDLIVMEFLGVDEPIAAALLVYRAVYTFFPLLIGSVLLGLHELHLQHEWLGSVLKGISGGGQDEANRTAPECLNPAPDGTDAAAVAQGSPAAADPPA